LTPTPTAAAEILDPVAHVIATQSCWVQAAREDGSWGWEQAEWTSEACEYTTYQSGSDIVFVFVGQSTGDTLTVGFDGDPHNCGTPSALPVSSAASWVVGPDTWLPCTYRLERASNQTYGQPELATFYSTDTKWIYVPVTSADDPVAFNFDGLDWTYWHDEAVVETCNDGSACTGDLGWAEECPDEVTPDMWWC
jgi:hypothetical protein